MPRHSNSKIVGENNTNSSRDPANSNSNINNQGGANHTASYHHSQSMNPRSSITKVD